MSESTSGPDLFNVLADEFAERYRRGERPPLSDYTDKYPELAEQIRELFPALVAIEQFGSGSDQSTGLTIPRPGTAGPIPERLGDYRILREIARGGMGIVYEAVQESLGRHVALKILPQNRLHDPNQLARFQREARAAAMLHHTNIVPVFGVGESSGVHHYAMQYIQGESLDDVLREVKRLRGFKPGETIPSSVPGENRGLAASVAIELVSGRLAGQNVVPTETVHVPASCPAVQVKDSATTPREADAGPVSSASAILGQSGSSYYRTMARLGVQAAEALAYAHHHKLLHRDIKPSNLLLDLHGTIWVTDFGLAKAEGADALTLTGDIVGTLRYMAPERFRGQADARSDVYALGLTLYEMLTLEPAFAAEDRARLIDKILHDEPAKPRQIDSRIPSDLETIVVKAIARDPSDRYRAASELAEDLRRYLADRPILSRRIGWIERSWRWSKRNPLVAAAVGTAAIALLAMTVTAVVYADRQSHFAREQEKANRQITRLNADLGNERDRLTNSLTESNRLLAIRNFDRGEAAFEKNQIGPGLLWMVASWRSAVAAGDRAWQHAARANLAAWQPHHARLKAVLSHEAPVDSAAFSPDGKTILTAGDDRTARLWDAVTGRPIGQPLRHQATVNSAAFSPDGKTILTGCADKMARRWDTATGRPIGSPLPHASEVFVVAYSPDGRTMLTVCGDTTARLWNASDDWPSGQPFAQLDDARFVAFSPDGKSIITAMSGGPVRLLDATTGRVIGSPLNLRAFVYAVAYSPDGKFVGTGYFNGAAQSWLTATGKPLGQSVRHHGSKIRAMAFSPDGRMLLTGSEDKTARLWDAVTNQPIGLPLLHQGPVIAAAFSPDGKSFLTASSDNTVRIWDAAPDQPFGLILENQDAGKVVAYGPDSTSVWSGTAGGSAKHWDAATGRSIGPTVLHQGPVFAVAVSPDGTRLLTGSVDKTARLWDAVTGKPIGPVLQHQDQVSVVAFCSDGKTMMTGGEDKTVRLWDAWTATPLGQPILQSGSVDGGAFSPDAKSFVVGGGSGAAQFWDLATRSPRGQPLPHSGCISAMAFSPDGKTLLTGCEDGAARLWDVEKRTLRVAPLLHEAWIFAVAFSPDGKTILTGSRDGLARLWDTTTGMPLGPPMRHPELVYNVAFSPDGITLLTASEDIAVRLFRRVPELPDDLERVAIWAEVLTGLTLNAAQGTIQVLDNAGWRECRERLDERGGPPESGGGPKLDSIRFGTDPTARARVLMERGQWDDAKAALDEVTRARPYDVTNWIELGRLHIARGQPERAGAEITSAVRLKPEKLGLRHFQFLSLLASGDRSGLRRASSDLLDHFGATTDHNTANNVAWYCVIGPNAVADCETSVRLAALAVNNAPDAEKPTSLNTLGAALYRAGRFEDSISRLKEGIQRRQGASLPEDWVFLALAHHRLGHRAEALRWLGRFLTYKRNENPNAFWKELEIRLLRSEAEAVILYDPVFPADPFTR